MKTKFLTFSAAWIITLASTLNAQTSKKDASPSPSPSPAGTPIKVIHLSTRPLPFNGKISATDKIAITFSTENKEKKIRVYEVTPETKITKKSGEATFADLKAGDEVRGTAIPKGDGKFETVSVIIGPREEPKVAVAVAVPSATPAPKSSKKAHSSPSPSPGPGTKRTD